jgi:hypothetical protein
MRKAQSTRYNRATRGRTCAVRSARRLPASSKENEDTTGDEGTELTDDAAGDPIHSSMDGDGNEIIADAGLSC